MNIFENHTYADPRAPFIFHDYSFPALKKANSMNWHENIEILYIKSGSATIKIEGDDIHVSDGDIVAIGANLLHGIITHSRLDFFCLIIDRSFCISNSIDTNMIKFDPKFQGKAIADEIVDFSRYYSDPSLPFRTLLLRSSALRILTLICSEHSRPTDTSTAENNLLSAVKYALGYIYSESHRPLSLDEIASVSGLSRFYLAHEFKRLTGQTVINYLNSIRCEKAASMLMDNSMSIGAIAHECGFSSCSYFIKTFRRFYNTSPGDYREHILKNKGPSNK